LKDWSEDGDLGTGKERQEVEGKTGRRWCASPIFDTYCRP